MLARYSLKEVKKIIRENYSHWNYWSDKDFDVFWLGYEKQTTPIYDYTKVDGVNSLYYSEEIFCCEVRKLQEEKFINYKDEGCTLLLVKYDGKELNFNDYIIKDLLKIKTERALRAYMTKVINYSRQSVSIARLNMDLPLRPQLSGKDVFSFILSIVGSLSGLVTLIAGR